MWMSYSPGKAGPYNIRLFCLGSVLNYILCEKAEELVLDVFIIIIVIILPTNTSVK